MNMQCSQKSTHLASTQIFAQILGQNMAQVVLILVSENLLHSLGLRRLQAPRYKCLSWK